MPHLRRLFLILLLALGAGLAVTGCGGSADPAQPVTIPAPRETGLRIGDVLAVSLQGIPEPQMLTLAIDDQGTITMPFLGPIPAAGRTESTLRTEIRDSYISRRIYNNVDVAVSAAQRFVFVGGQVARPGRVLWTPGLTLSKAIKDAGDFTLYSRRNGVILSRDETSYTVSVEAALANPALDVRLFPGDSIDVPRSRF